MILYLARHGNTFAPGDKVVWTGGTLDLPLVEKGQEQAQSVAAAMAPKGIVPTGIFCGPLERTKTYAEIISRDLKLNIPPVIDSRLNEIDYGGWTGLTNDEVASNFGASELNAWNSQSAWPGSAGWSETDESIFERVNSFADDLLLKYRNNETVLAISSNGVLRYFLKLIPGEFERRVLKQAFKVKTGNICRLNYTDNRFNLDFWNKPPGIL